jgi:hypothetical protein
MIHRRIHVGYEQSVKKTGSDLIKGFLILGFGLVLGAFGVSGQTGPLTKEGLLNEHKDWAEVKDAYRPRPDAIDRIRSFWKPVTIEIFLGTWSADSRDLVGRFFKIQESLDPAAVSVSLIGVSPDGTSPADVLQANAVEIIPTLIIRVDDLEIGRIVGPPQEPLEDGLDAILASYIDPSTIDLNDRESLRGIRHNTFPIPCWPCHVPSRPASARRFVSLLRG